MTSKVLYKFKSSKDFDVLHFNGIQIRLFDLKRKIIERKKLDKELDDFELKIINNSTGQVYDNDDAFVPKNTDLIVQRVPTTQNMGVLTNAKSAGSKAAAPAPVKTIKKPILEDADLSTDIFATKVVAKVEPEIKEEKKETVDDEEEEEEEGNDDEKLKMVSMLAERIRGPTLNRSGRYYNKSYAAKNGTTINMEEASNLFTGDLSKLQGNKGQVSRGAIQRKNAQRGGYGGQQQQLQKKKRVNAGIPKNYLEEETGDKDADGAEKVDTEANNEDTKEPEKPSSWQSIQGRKKSVDENAEKEPLTLEEVRSRINQSEVPNTLRCALDNTLLKDAVLLPCCYNSCSLKIIQAALVDTKSVCPICGTPDIKEDKLVANKQLDVMVEKFLADKKKQFEQPEPENGVNNNNNNNHGPPFGGGPRPFGPGFHGPRPGYGWDGPRPGMGWMPPDWHGPPRGPDWFPPGPRGPWMPHPDPYHPMNDWHGPRGPPFHPDMRDREMRDREMYDREMYDREMYDREMYDRRGPHNNRRRDRSGGRRERSLDRAPVRRREQDKSPRNGEQPVEKDVALPEGKEDNMGDDKPSEEGRAPSNDDRDRQPRDPRDRPLSSSRGRSRPRSRDGRSRYPYDREREDRNRVNSRGGGRGSRDFNDRPSRSRSNVGRRRSPSPRRRRERERSPRRRSRSRRGYRGDERGRGSKAARYDERDRSYDRDGEVRLKSGRVLGPSNRQKT